MFFKNFFLSFTSNDFFCYRCKERSKIATKLAANRKERRKYKDTEEVLRPLVEWVNSDYGKKAVDMLSQALGQMRKREEAQSCRQYKPRVLKKKKNILFVKKNNAFRAPLWGSFF